MLKDKSIQFTPKLFFATLLQIYILPFWEKVALNFFPNLSEEERSLIEKGFSYLLAQDLLSVEFSQWYREHLLGRDYSLKVYMELALEFLKLKEQIRKQIQIPLLDELKKLCMELEGNLEEGKEISEGVVRKLRRIYKFFKIVERLFPSQITSLVERSEDLLLKLNSRIIKDEDLEFENREEIERIFEEELQKLSERVKI
ncbi:MAG: hypothetical protein ACK4K4_02125 [Caldimicrobium sp.]